jgi:hypothetical protein
MNNVIPFITTWKQLQQLLALVAIINPKALDDTVCIECNESLNSAMLVNDAAGMAFVSVSSDNDKPTTWKQVHAMLEHKQLDDKPLLCMDYTGESQDDKIGNAMIMVDEDAVNDKNGMPLTVWSTAAYEQFMS